MNRAIRQRFDRAGAGYEASALVQREVAARLAGLCPPRLDGPVLEIGAGSGFLTRLLVPRLTGGPYVALDLSPGMLTHAAMPGAAKLAADGERPPFAPGTFPFLVSASAMQWYADPARSLPADLALLRPGGSFALAIFVEGTLAELAEASRVTGFGSVYPLRPAEAYASALADVPGIVYTMERERHVVTHVSVVGLLKSLKGAGVTHTPGAKVASAARYRAFLRCYAERFAASGGVRATYAVAYFRGRSLAAPPWVSMPRFSSRQA
jgi:malonyl-CoA O-methyltransferase